jgi:murein DD-endopeptidase MepM/ murein hydrolase activator NlpD
MLFVVPIVAVVIILASVWRWGGVRTARVEGDADVRAVLSFEHPEWEPSEVTCAVDARAALAGAPPDPSVAVVFASGDMLTSRLLHAGDLAAVEAEPWAGGPDNSVSVRRNARRATLQDDVNAAPAPPGDLVTARLRLHDVGCPQVALTLSRGQWATWAPRLQRLVGGSVMILAVSWARTAFAAPAAGRMAVPHAAPCDGLYRASWSPETPRPGTLFRVQLTTAPGTVAPGARVGSEPLHFAPAGDAPTNGAASGSLAGGSPAAASRGQGGGVDTWAALAAVAIDAERSIALRIACPDASGDTATIRIPLAAASYPMERLRVAPRFSVAPDSALSARMAREAERAAQVSRTSHETPPLWTSPFTRPRESRITSAFGHGRVFNGSVTSRHMGTDYAGGTGAPVYAANRGVVRLVDEFYLGGNVVYIDHGAGLVTAYLHLSKPLVAEGDTVERGARIGLVGATGRVTGPHLHWIARYGRVSVDPASLLRATSAPGATGAVGGAAMTKTRRTGRP